ncbi:hypothetical protein C8R45DRAFT_960590, partial [Mycena sanguinolenta]
LESGSPHPDPLNECDVMDEGLQDPMLLKTYIDLPPLKRRHIHPTFVSGGNWEARPIQYENNIWFSSWATFLKKFDLRMLASVMSFVESGQYVNPVRVSPLKIATSPTKAASANCRLTMGKSGPPAAFVTAGMCTDSCLTKFFTTTGVESYIYKYVSMLLHSQDRERFDAFMCLCFGREHLYTSMTDGAIQFSSALIKPGGSVSEHTQSTTPIPRSMLSPSKPSSSSTTTAAVSAYRTYSLSPHSEIPAYNAIGRSFDFTRDVANVQSLPKWEGEIPLFSFIVVG